MCRISNWRPNDIPADPSTVYGEEFKKAGGWGGFLGTGVVAPQLRQYRPMEAAAAWARQQGIATGAQWAKQCQVRDWLPSDIPADPRATYGEEFRKIGGWGGFLGTEFVASRLRQWRPIEEAARWAQEQGLATSMQWRHNCVKPGWRPRDIPANPLASYGREAFDAIGGWSGFLGAKTVKQQSKIERMLRYVLEDCFNQSHGTMQSRIIGSSGKKYKVDFLAPAAKLIVEYDGCFYHADRFTFDAAKTDDLTAAGWNVIRVRSSKAQMIDPSMDIAVNQTGSLVTQIHSLLDHLLLLSDRDKIALSPLTKSRLIFWSREKLFSFNFRDVLQNFDGFRPLKEAMDWVKKQNIKSRAEWQVKCGEHGWLPEDIPAQPPFAYGREAFKAIGGWGGWLGTGYIHKKELKPIEEAMAWVQAQGLSTQKEWQAKVKVPGWLPVDIPAEPTSGYGKEAFNAIGGFGGWLGTGRVATFKRQYLPLMEAVAWIRCQGIRSLAEWRSLSKQPGYRPDNIPTNFHLVYGEEFRQFGGWSAITGNMTGGAMHKQRKLGRP